MLYLKNSTRMSQKTESITKNNQLMHFKEINFCFLESYETLKYILLGKLRFSKC